MAAAFPLSTAPPLPLRHSAAGISLAFHLGRSRRTRHDGRCALRLPAAAAGVTCGRTRRATAVAAAQGQTAAGEGIHDSAGEGSLRMVLLSTAVAVCGSFEFGTCVGYSAPAQAGIVSDIGLSNSEYGVFGSILTIGAMIGALTSGRLADTLGRKTTMRLAAIVGIFGWLTIYFAKGATMLYLGRVLLGYCTGVISYVQGPVLAAWVRPRCQSWRKLSNAQRRKIQLWKPLAKPLDRPWIEHAIVELKLLHDATAPRRHDQAT